MSGMRGLLLLSLLSLLMVGCGHRQTHQSLLGDGLPRLLPVRDFVANVDYNGHYRISPDGTRLAWKAVAGLREEIFVRTLGRDDTRSLGFDAQGYPFVWAQDSRRLLFIKDAGGNENFHLFRVDSERPGQQPVDITPQPNTRSPSSRSSRTIRPTSSSSTTAGTRRCSTCTGSTWTAASRPCCTATPRTWSGC